MTHVDLDTYLLDTVGFVHLRNHVPLDLIDKARDLLLDRTTKALSTKVPILDIDPTLFLKIATASPKLPTLCRSVLGDSYRLDCAFVRVQPDSQGREVVNLHGGPGGAGGFHMWSHQAGRTLCSQMSVGIPLMPQGGKQGGFIYVPGTHKTNLPVNGWELHTKANYFNGDLEHPMIQCPELRPGDVCVFPEVMIHGAKKWIGAEPRATLYFMFVPGNVMWKARVHTSATKVAAEELGIGRLVADPGVVFNEERPLGMTENTWRPKT